VVWISLYLGASLLFVASYVAVARNFDRARLILFIVGAIGPALPLAIVVYDEHVAVRALGGLVLASSAFWLAVSAFYPTPFSISGLHYRLRQTFNPAVRLPVTRIDFRRPSDVQHIYYGPIYGWHVGDWAAKGPPLGNFGVATALGPDGRVGCLALWADNSDQLYFETTPELKLIGPNYYDLLNTDFEVSLKELSPIATRENVTLHAFVASPIIVRGRRRSVCYSHRVQLSVSPEEWRIFSLPLKAELLEPQIQYENAVRYRTNLEVRRDVDRYIKAIDNDEMKRAVLRRVAYIGVMYIADGKFRNGIGASGILGVGHFKIGS
jgi:hypothetical protein